MHGELDIGNLTHLKVLGVGKTNITKLKGEIGKLQNLQKIDVSHTRLIELPAGISELSSLEFLDLTLTDPNKPHLSETLPGSLKTLAISSSSLPVLPSSLNFLDICYCEHLKRLPSLANLTNLTGLHLKKVGVREIPGLGELKLLETLYIDDCPRLGTLDGLENLLLLKELCVQVCPVLEKLPSLSKLTKLHKLEVHWCRALVEIHGVGELWDTLLHLFMGSCSSLTGIEALHSMVKLETLVLSGMGLTIFLPPSLSMFTKLSKLSISEDFGYGLSDGVHWASLKQFQDLSSLKNLRELAIRNCLELIEVTGLDMLELLEWLELEGCRSIKMLPDLSGLVKLTTFTIWGCTQLTEVRGLGRLESLLHLWIFGCQSIKELPNLSGLKNLTIFYVTKCRQLKEVNGLEGLKSLQVFEMDKRLKVKYVLKSFSRYGKQLVTRSVRRALFINN